MAVDGLEGLDDILRNLDKAEDQINQVLRTWKIRSAVRVKGDAVKGAPRERGNLAGSAYIDAKVRAQSDSESIKENDNLAAIDGDTDVYVGFTAAYAIFVHENLEQKWRGLPRKSGLGTYWNPGGPKFLTNALNDNESDIYADIKNLLNTTGLR